MGELIFVGLGLHDEKGVTLAGLEAARSADLVYAEFYTSALLGAPLDRIEGLIGRPVRVLGREDIEQGDELLRSARERRVVLLVPGDPMAATTHVDLRLRAARASIPTRVVHGVSILTAAAGALGLQAYKLGRTATVPFPASGFRPLSPVEAIRTNLTAGLHTLVLLDLREDGSFLDPKDALRFVLETAASAGIREIGPGTLACVLSRVGGPEVRAHAGPMAALLDRDLGPPLHCLVVPGDLHFLEKEALAVFAGDLNGSERPGL